MNPAALNSVTSDGALVSALMSMFKGAPEKQKQILKDCRHLDTKRIPKPHMRIGLHDQLSIISNTTKILGPYWYFNAPEFWDQALDNVFGTAMRTAPTLGEAINVLTQYGFLWSPALTYENYRGPNAMTVTIDVVHPVGLAPELEAGLSSLRNMALIAPYLVIDRTLRGRWDGAEISIAVSKGAVKNLSRFFAAKISTDTQRNAITMPEKLHQRKSREADPARFRKSSLQVQNFVYPPDHDRSLEIDVKAYIDATLFHRPTVGEVAKSVGMSTRTLNRRLEEVGVSFRDLLEQSLQSRTEILLKQGQLSRGEIAERLGYKDHASFSRALRRWQTA